VIDRGKEFGWKHQGMGKAGSGAEIRWDSLKKLTRGAKTEGTWSDVREIELRNILGKRKVGDLTARTEFRKRVSISQSLTDLPLTFGREKSKTTAKVTNVQDLSGCRPGCSHDALRRRDGNKRLKKNGKK
jgi:hypothetical protein